MATIGPELARRYASDAEVYHGPLVEVNIYAEELDREFVFCRYRYRPLPMRLKALAWNTPRWCGKENNDVTLSGNVVKLLAAC